MEARFPVKLITFTDCHLPFVVIHAACCFLMLGDSSKVIKAALRDRAAVLYMPRPVPHLADVGAVGLPALATAQLPLAGKVAAAFGVGTADLTLVAPVQAGRRLPSHLALCPCTKALLKSK